MPAPVCSRRAVTGLDSSELLADEARRYAESAAAMGATREEAATAVREALDRQGGRRQGGGS